MFSFPSHTQLSELRPYLPLMRPSLLLRRLPNSSNSQIDMATLDQEVNGTCPLFAVGLFKLNQQCCDWIFDPWSQAYYLCYSLLTLANEASNFQPIFPANQKVLPILIFNHNCCWLSAVTLWCCFSFCFIEGHPAPLLRAGYSHQVWHQRKREMSLPEQGKQSGKKPCWYLRLHIFLFRYR